MPETAAGVSELVSMAAPLCMCMCSALFACKYILAWDDFSVRSLHVV